MHASAKYLIHAAVRTDGVVERSDVVGAIFGQTEGLLGDQLDLRDLQESSKLGRIDVDIESEGGRAVGSITIASGLDRVETAVLAAALETIDRVGPCRAECAVTSIEDARAAKRRALVDRATELLTDLEETTVTSEQLVEEVRKNARVEEITEYEGLPAGPRVASSDAIIIVEGRADVRRLLKYGIRNAVAVEGTDVPVAIAELTFDRNATAFLDGDRGGDLILRELQQVADIDYVAFAPTDQSVEDLERTAILSALRRKVPLEQVTEEQSPREVFGPTDTGGVSTNRDDSQTDRLSSSTDPDTAVESVGDSTSTVAETHQTENERTVDASDIEKTGETPDAPQDVPASPAIEAAPTETATVDGETGTESNTESVGPEETVPTEELDESDTSAQSEPQTLAGHVQAVIGSGRGDARFIDDEFDVLDDVAVNEAFESLAESDRVPTAIIVDGTLTQRLLDLAAQQGVRQIIAAELGEFVKQPVDVRVRSAADLELDA